MRWRDSRFEKPDKSHGQLFCKSMCSNVVYLCDWDQIPAIVSWLPTNELPQRSVPDKIPAGWRVVDKAVDCRETFSHVAAWDVCTCRWMDCAAPEVETWLADVYYIVLIAQRYRAFANAVEFIPHAGRLWQYKDKPGVKIASVCVHPPAEFSDTSHDSDNWHYSFKNKEFVDMVDGRLVASPFGVKIE